MKTVQVHTIEYRETKHGILKIKNLMKFDTERAMELADKYKDMGYHDVTIRILNKKINE